MDTRHRLEGEAMSVTPISPPGPGQLVSVRSRRWVVGEVRSGTLPTPSLEPVPAGPLHFVALLSVEDDALDVELQVIWEIEPGAVVVEKVVLPEPTGSDLPDRLDAFLDAVRWGGRLHRRPQDWTSPRMASAQIRA